MSGRSPSRRRTGGGAALFWNAAVVVLVGLAAAVGASVLLARIQYGFWPFRPPKGFVRPAGYYTDAAKIALTVAGGIGGAVALVVSYRRQRLLERDEKGLHDRYGAAAAQLGDENPTIRLAGVYALANLADEWAPRRQQCVDVLCAYLRMPWDPEPADKHPIANRAITEKTGDVETTYTFPPSLGEKEVRETILRVIAAHLRRPHRHWWQLPAQVQASWENITLDFTSAYLPGAHFDFCCVGANVSFANTTFCGESTFKEVSFHRGSTFTNATFTHMAIFNDVTFGQTADFREATFEEGGSFGRTRFQGPADFSRARLEDVRFYDAPFHGRAIFNGAIFTGPGSWVDTVFHGIASFDRADFRGNAEFDECKFQNAATFNKTIFQAKVTYAAPTFRGSGNPFVNAVFRVAGQPTLLLQEPTALPQGEEGGSR